MPHSRDPGLRAVVEAVAHDADVDWEAAGVSSDPLEQAAIEQVRLVLAIGLTARKLAARWGPFELREQVGHGAFGTVYRAWDPKLDRIVALKLIHGEAAGPREGRGIHEARLLATVDHAHIVPVYGADIHDGRTGIWMKFIHGKTLKETLLEQGPFSPEEAASIGRDICQALAEVHRRGLLHGDIKAQNVMREVGGRTVVTDFGSGQLLDTAADVAVKGSPAYLAPEVCAGSPPSVRSDIYSLAVLLYHLVSQDFPVIAGTWPELCEKHARGQQRPLLDLRPDLPRWFVEAVAVGLSSDPDQRPASAATMYSLLSGGERKRGWRRSTFLRAGAVALAIGSGAWLYSRPSAVVSTPSSIVIDRFENLTGSTDVDFLTTGLPQQVGSRLAKLSGVRVVVPSNVIRADAGADFRGRFDADAVLKCQILGTGQRLRLACNLETPETNQSVWTDTSDHSLEDMAALGSELVRRVAFIMRGGQLTREEADRLTGERIAPEALSLYLKGRHEWSLRTEESLSRSVDLFIMAARTDPRFGLPHSGLADAYSLLGAYGFMSRPLAYGRALEAAEVAVRMDATMAESHLSLGYARKNAFEWPGAEDSFRRGLELNPHSSIGHHWYSIYLSQMGRFTEALAEAKAAISLDPSSLAARTNLAALLMMARRYQDSIAAWSACIDLGSNQVNTYRAMSKAHLYAGDHQRALEFAEAARRRLEAGAADEELKADLAYVYASVGRRGDAMPLVDELTLRYTAAREPIAGSIAAAYTGLGDYETAFEWLETALREQDPELGYLLVDPKWDPLRSDPRFQQLLVTLRYPDR